MKLNIFFIAAVLFFTGCKDEKSKEYPALESFPTEVGTEWNYKKEVIIKTFESATSQKVVNIDTILVSIKVWVEKDTVLRDTIPARVFISKESDSEVPSKQYMFVDPEGLKCYAYSLGGSEGFAKKNANIDCFQGIFLPDTGIKELSGDTDIIYEKVPTLNLKLPLEAGLKWTYRQPVEAFEPFYSQIDKEVTGYETLKIGSNSYSCYKVKWIYFDNNEMSVTDWISKEGLIKRQLLIETYEYIELNGKPKQFLTTITIQ